MARTSGRLPKPPPGCSAPTDFVRSLLQACGAALCAVPSRWPSQSMRGTSRGGSGDPITKPNSASAQNTLWCERERVVPDGNRQPAKIGEYIAGRHDGSAFTSGLPFHPSFQPAWPPSRSLWGDWIIASCTRKTSSRHSRAGSTEGRRGGILRPQPCPSSSDQAPRKLSAAVSNIVGDRALFAGDGLLSVERARGAGASWRRLQRRRSRPGATRRKRRSREWQRRRSRGRGRSRTRLL